MISILERYNITPHDVQKFLVTKHFFRDSEFNFINSIQSANILKLRFHPITLEFIWNNFNNRFIDYLSNLDGLTVDHAERSAFILARIPSIKSVTIKKTKIFPRAFNKLKEAGKMIDARYCEDLGALSEKKLCIIFLVYSFALGIFAVSIIEFSNANPVILASPICALPVISLFFYLITFIQKLSAYNNFYYRPIKATCIPKV